MTDATGPLAGLRLLVVDDDTDNLESVSTLLEMNGAEVRRCRTAESAREQWSAFRPHLLVSDLAMPGENGFDLIVSLRRLSPADGGRLPAIAFSASTDPLVREQALESGFHTFVHKLDVSTLVTTIVGLTRGIG